jgi:hypothetical protein
MEAVRPSETLLNFHQATLSYIPEDNDLHSHRRENLKSNKPFHNQYFTDMNAPETKTKEVWEKMFKHFIIDEFY